MRLLQIVLGCVLLGLASSSDSHHRSLADAGHKLQPAVTKYNLKVTLGVNSASCFPRTVVLVNGKFQPTLYVPQGNILEVRVQNDIPDDFPQVTEGISIHWHGFNMRKNSWYDGSGYVAQCPIKTGTSFTYRFPVDEAPGTYIWHGHAGANTADGFQGALIVLPRKGKQDPFFTYDDERLIVTQDWWHSAGNAMSMKLNRPFDFNKSTPATGQWHWVNLPQAMLINGKGYFGDCALIGGMGPFKGQAAAETTCCPSSFSVDSGASVELPWAPPLSGGCTHEVIRVTAGKTYRFRIINAASLVFTTTCFAGHSVTIVAVDAAPINPVVIASGCVELGPGQRYDVLLKADQAPANYWITALPQYRIGSPNGYAVLRYVGAANNTQGTCGKQADPVLFPGGTYFPTTPALQPGSVLPWTIAQYQQLTVLDKLTKSFSDIDREVGKALYPVGYHSLAVPSAARDTLVLDITQPLLKNGVLRWAINNVASAETPPCINVLQEVYDDPKWFTKRAVGTRYNGYDGETGIQEGDGKFTAVFLESKTPTPENPSTGLHVAQLDRPGVVDIVLQNLPASALNGDYRNPVPPRIGQEPHPFHLHGHHFWVVGSGEGVWNRTLIGGYNLKNPVYRDTVTLPKGGWATIRFVSDNPGVWLLHCHILWHLYMGQAIYIIERPTEIDDPPRNMPVCSPKCTYQFAPWSPAYAAAKFGSSGYEWPTAP